MVITVELDNYTVKKVLIDQGSSVDILYWTTYQKLQLPTNAMIPYDEPIYGFSGEKVSTCGYIDLHTVFRDGTQTKTIPIRFLVVDVPTSYNVLLGQPSLNTLGVVVSMPHLAMKFPSPSGDILTIHATNSSHKNATWLAYVHNYPSYKQTTLNAHSTLT